ncbi:Chromatin accessibility complex protein 1 [Trachymyrmex septentrionalis]|uniref:Chromatin accessibility complex protein 1 n=1 Tax=Trachymyrmex septentrionalis TaxID=34720 RepID=A0A195EVR2_9HYME|nr:PREDICTED: chromatin accessibility complex protein 1-like [Trachymyrmex septentrionalis]KYN32350.1 Chromatin accessibility complex protein 1 [Trachymyrmex septentrionalis]
MSTQSSSVKLKELRLPISRVKTIMKSSPSVDTVGQDGLFLVTKATELFIHYLTEEAHMQSNKGPSLDYKHLAEIVQTNDTLEFLREIMPRKITVRQFKEMMAAKEPNSSSSSESSSDSDSDSDSDTDSCSDSDETKGDNGNSSSSEQESETKENGACHSDSDKSESSVKSDSEENNKR